jgi:hypothetical protein
MITFIEKIRTYSKWFLPVNMGFFSAFMGFIQAFYLVLRFFSNEMGILSVSVEYYFLVLFSLYTVPIFFQLVSAIFSRNRWLHLTGLFVGLIIYDLLIAYHFKTMDIGPTIVDVTQSRIGTHNMQGQSIFSGQSEHPIFLIQHYLKQFSVVRWPFKYRLQANIQQEFAYDLQKDPMEERNIYSALSKKQKEQFHTDLKTIYISEAAMQKNLFYAEKH